jgi:quinol monooxygenase YgiN
MSYVVIAEWVAREGDVAEVEGILRSMMPPSREEPGCRSYAPVQSIDDPRRFTLVEEYDDEAAYEAHRASEHFQALVVGRALALLDTRVVSVHRPVAR